MHMAAMAYKTKTQSVATTGMGLRNVLTTAALTIASATIVISYMLRSTITNPTTRSLDARISITRPSTEFLHLKPDGSFQIGIFTDLHYGESQHAQWGPLQDQKSDQVMRTVLGLETMDLAVFNGDQVTGYDLHLENATDYIDRVLAPVLDEGIPWASTYGNHDNEYNITHEQIFERESRYAGSMTRRMVPGTNNLEGISNYYLPVFASADSDPLRDTPELLLWFFDSRSGMRYQEKDPSYGFPRDEIPLDGFVHPRVADWFKTTAADLASKHGPIPSVAFFHIIPSAAQFFQRAGGRDPELQPGIDEESVCAQGDPFNQGHNDGSDIPFLAALLEAKQNWGLQATFSGHDHGNSWCYKWNKFIPGMTLTGNGLNLCFGAVTGYGGYGTWLRGSRQIVMRKGTSDIETYIRYEGGSVNNRVMLNSTYGQDRYPVVPVRRSYLRESDNPDFQG